MRCPKCGYISFDRQRSCGKCSHDLTAVAEQLQGTAIKAEAPFFLAAALGKKIPAAAEPALDLAEEDEAIALDELAAEAPPADEEELDFAGAPLDEDDLAEQSLPSLGLEDIDVSDLMPPPQEEEEEPVLSLESEPEETLPSPPAPAPAPEEDARLETEPSSPEPDESLNLYEQESLFGGLEETTEPSAEAEEEEIIDLSALMDFEETPAPPAAQKEKEEKHEILELSLEDGEGTPAPAEAPKKPASTVADIPDLGLTLENDDQ